MLHDSLPSGKIFFVSTDMEGLPRCLKPGPTCWALWGGMEFISEVHTQYIPAASTDVNFAKLPDSLTVEHMLVLLTAVTGSVGGSAGGTVGAGCSWWEDLGLKLLPRCLIAALHARN